jgi:hypothetical protein
MPIEAPLDVPDDLEATAPDEIAGEVLLRSVSGDVIRYARCPVVVVRHAEVTRGASGSRIV